MRRGEWIECVKGRGEGVCEGEVEGVCEGESGLSV